MKYQQDKKLKFKKVEEHHRRLASEEAQRIKEKLVFHEEKISKSNARNRDYLTMRQDHLRRRNQSLEQKLTMFRT